MKVSSYSISGPCKGICKQHMIIAKEENSNGYYPLIYLQRPKWIEDNECWEKICYSVLINLPNGFEVK